MEKKIASTNYGALTTLTTVFFFWGFIAAGNNIFIPFCKHYFQLDQFQSLLIDFAFYFAYYIGAMILFLASSFSGRDLVGHWGYKRSIVYGLLFSALGAVAMIISVQANVFAGMLFGLFVVALGFSLQQTSANPFMISLGDESTGSNRISLGGSINSLGTSIGPVIIALALFGTAASIPDEQIASLSLSKVIILYASVGCLFLGVAALFGFSKSVPDGKVETVPAPADADEGMIDGPVTEAVHRTKAAKKAISTLLIMTGLLVACIAPVFNSYRSNDTNKQIAELQQDLETVRLDEQGVAMTTVSDLQLETEKKIQLKIDELQTPVNNMRLMCWTAGVVVVVGGILVANVRGSRRKEGWGAMQFSQLTLGMLAIFVYVGVEVAIGGNLSELLSQKEFGEYTASQVTPFISMYWGSLMIGRWAASISVFNLTEQAKLILRFFIPLIAFGVVLAFASLAGYEIAPLYWYVVCVLIQIAAFYFTKDKPAFTLTVFGVLGILATLVGVMTTGTVAVYALLSAGLFCSIMWPCIFSLSLAGLGKYQAQGSALLVMMILGGAIIPPLQGLLSDVPGVGIQKSFLVGTLCFAYITFFAVYVNRLLKKRGVSLD